MLMENKFGKISRITACAALKDGKTILEDLSFTAPYKVLAAVCKRERRNPDHASLCLRGYYGRGFTRNFLTM